MDKIAIHLQTGRLQIHNPICNLKGSAAKGTKIFAYNEFDMEVLLHSVQDDQTRTLAFRTTFLEAIEEALGVIWSQNPDRLPNDFRNVHQPICRDRPQLRMTKSGACIVQIYVDSDGKKQFITYDIVPKFKIEGVDAHDRMKREMRNLYENKPSGWRKAIFHIIQNNSFYFQNEQELNWHDYKVIKLINFGPSDQFNCMEYFPYKSTSLLTDEDIYIIRATKVLKDLSESEGPKSIVIENVVRNMSMRLSHQLSLFYGMKHPQIKGYFMNKINYTLWEGRRLFGSQSDRERIPRMFIV